MSNLGEMRHFLVMEIHQYEVGIFISQKKHAWEIQKKFHLERAKLVAIR